MVELVDTTDSKSVAFGCGGSSPPTGTNNKKALTTVSVFFCFSEGLTHQIRAIHNPEDPLLLESVLSDRFHQWQQT